MSIGNMTKGFLFLGFCALLYFIYAEIRQVHTQLATLNYTVQILEETNKTNLENFIKSKEFQSVIEELRIEREKGLLELTMKLNDSLFEYSKMVDQDADTKNWDRQPVPQWIIDKNLGDK